MAGTIDEAKAQDSKIEMSGTIPPELF